MTDRDDQDERPGDIQLARPKKLTAVSMEPSRPPLIEEISDPRPGIGGLPATIRFEVKLLADTEHALLKRLAQRHGLPMTLMMRKMLMRGLRLQEEQDRGREIAVTQNNRILFKVL